MRSASARSSACVGMCATAGSTTIPARICTCRNAQVPDALNALNVRITPVAWVVRTRGEPYAVQRGDPGAVAAVERTAGVGSAIMEEVVSRSISRQRFNVLLMTVFGASALLLAAIGIYGLMAYSVAQRTQEIGIRMALGAEAEQVRKMVVFQGMRLAVDRGRGRARGCVCVDAADGELPLWRPGARPGRVRRDAGAADGGVDRCRSGFPLAARARSIR